MLPWVRFATKDSGKKECRVRIRGGRREGGGGSHVMCNFGKEMGMRSGDIIDWKSE